MIHPTRTNLLRLREKAVSIGNSVAILKARRQALIREFLESIRPFIGARDAIKRQYRDALRQLHLAEGHEGMEFIRSIAEMGERDVGADVASINIMGVKYRDLTVYGPFVRSPDARDFGYTATTPHLEEAAYQFEKLVEVILERATFESRIKMLGEEVLRVTHRTRVLEERVLPQLMSQAKSISQYISERDRESHFRLRRFKARRARRVVKGRRERI